MNEFSWWISTSIFAIGALLSTGSFLQKSKDNFQGILELKKRVESLEKEREEIATLVVKLQNLDSKVSDFKLDMKSGLNEFKILLKEHADRIDRFIAKGGNLDGRNN